MLPVLEGAHVAPAVRRLHEPHPPRRALAQRGQGHPERTRHLDRRDDLHVGAHEGDEWPNDDGRQGARTGTEVVELADQSPVAGDVDPRFLPRLAHCCHGKVAVPRLHPPAGTRDVPAPRVARGIRALDHQQLRLAVLPRAEHEQDRSKARPSLRGNLPGRMLRDRAHEALDERMCRKLVELRRGHARNRSGSADARASNGATGIIRRCRRRTRPSRGTLRRANTRSCSPSAA